MPRVRDPELLRRLHLEWRSCALADDTCEWWRSLHHIHRHPRDDVRANLVMLCGDGVAGHHGRIEANDDEARAQLGLYIARHRPDTIAYINEKLPNGRGWAWLEHRLFLPDT